MRTHGLTEIGPVIALRRQTDYQLSPNWLSGAEMSYRSLGSDEVTLRNYRPVGRRKGNISLSDPLAAGVSLTFINPAPLGGIGIRLGPGVIGET
jgi:hypothetical protein